MIKVLIADDEVIECKGVKCLIQKDFPQLDILPFVHNGFELIKSVEKNSPDLVLLDIGMPGMTGLEALEIIRLKQSKTKIIIISAYSSFDYAQKALKLGAGDYLLKPVTRGALEVAMRKQINELEKERFVDARERDHLSLEQNYRDLLEDKLCLELIAGNIDLGQIRSTLEQLKLDADHGYATAIIRPTQAEDTKTFLGEVVQKMRTICSCICACHKQKLYLIYFFSQAETDTSYRTKIEDDLHFSLWGMQEHRMMKIGISQYKTSLEELKSALSESAMALYESTAEKMNFYTVNFYTAANAMDNSEQFLKHYIKFRYQYLSFLSTNKMWELEHLIKKFVESTGAEKNTPVQKLCFADLLLRIRVSNPAYAEKQVSLWNCWKVISEKEESISVRDIILQESDFSKISLAREQKQMHPYIQASLYYMQNHYMNNISLEQTAKEISITPFYLSRLFKQELNHTFLEILTDIRMEKAIELLGVENLPAKDISSMIGYPNSNYFYKLFKAQTGMTQTQMKEFLYALR